MDLGKIGLKSVLYQGTASAVPECAEIGSALAAENLAVDLIGPSLGFTMSKDMSAIKLNKHAQRTKETREQLLRAAEVIFVRDGFEKSDLSDIAALAGRTRGAIYAQFKSKEDVFLALMEEKTRENRARLEGGLIASHSPEENLKSYRQFWIGMIEDPGWSILLLEFKLFTLRRPDSREQLKMYYDSVFSADHEKKLITLLGSPGRGKDALSRSASVQALQSLISALAIETGFAPSLSKDTLRKVATRIFNALLQPPAQI